MHGPGEKESESPLRGIWCVDSQAPSCPKRVPTEDLLSPRVRMPCTARLRVLAQRHGLGISKGAAHSRAGGSWGRLGKQLDAIWHMSEWDGEEVVLLFLNYCDTTVETMSRRVS